MSLRNTREGFSADGAGSAEAERALAHLGSPPFASNPSYRSEAHSEDTFMVSPMILQAQNFSTPQDFGSHQINSSANKAVRGKIVGKEDSLGFVDQSVAMDKSTPLHHQTLGQIAETFHDRNRGSGKSKDSDFDESGDEGEVEEEVEGGPSNANGGSESTGRWTRQEHELFLEALKKYGKEWKKVASMVKTRTVVQTRTHAQKYFQKLAKTNGGAFGSADDVLGAADKLSKRSTSGGKRAKRHDDSPTEALAAAHLLSSGGLTEFSAPLMQMSTPMHGSFVGMPNYYPLDCDELTPFSSHITPTSQPVDVPRLRIPPPPPHYDFPQPSPAACGKRKHAELTAAEMLAGSAQSNRSGSADVEGMRTLSRLRDDSDPSSAQKYRVNLALSIVDPDTLHAPEGYFADPGTPWDAQIQALSAQVRAASSSNGNNPDLKVSVSTPSEQRQFLSQVRAMIADSNVGGLKALFEAAEASADSYLARMSPRGHSRTMSVSDLMGINTAPVDDEAKNEKAALSSSNNNSGARDLIRRSLNKVGTREQTVLHDAVALDSPQTIVLELCKLLLDYGAVAKCVDPYLNTCLHLAAEKGFERVGRLLLTKGCPVNAVNSEGDAAVHIATKLGHGLFLEMLVSLGANFHLRNGQALSPIDLAGNHVKDPVDREHLRKLLFTLEPRLRTLILYHDDFLEHSARKPSDWEAPDRLQQIMRRLRDAGEFREFEMEISSQFEKGDVELLARVHSADYLSFVNNLSKQVQQQQQQPQTVLADGRPVDIPGAPVPFTPQVQRYLLRQSTDEIKPTDQGSDTAFSAGTLSAARRSAGAVAYAVDRVMLGRNRNVFCVVRPPGHHAGYRGLLDGVNSCGFCIFNNVAAGALHALEDHHCERVAIIDLDIHHGNGTEDIVRRYPNPSRLFFFSVHLYDHDEAVRYQFYPGTGRADDHVHNVVNVPLAPLWKTTPPSEGTRRPAKPLAGPVPDGAGAEEANAEEVVAGREAFRRAILQRLIPSLRAFNPSLILLSMGFDTLNDDVGNCKHNASSKAVPQRGMDLGVADVAWVTAEIMKIADICCNGRLVSVLEGGYGQYASNANSKNYATRSGAAQPGPQIDANAMESQMNRGMLAEAAAAHVHRLIDPYGPAQTFVSTASRSSGASSAGAMVPPPPPQKRS